MEHSIYAYLKRQSKEDLESLLQLHLLNGDELQLISVISEILRTLNQEKSDA